MGSLQAASMDNKVGLKVVTTSQAITVRASVSCYFNTHTIIAICLPAIYCHSHVMSPPFPLTLLCYSVDNYGQEGRGSSGYSGSDPARFPGAGESRGPPRDGYDRGGMMHGGRGRGGMGRGGMG